MAWNRNPDTTGFAKKIECSVCSKQITTANFNRHFIVCTERVKNKCLKCGESVFNRENKYCSNDCRKTFIKKLKPYFEYSCIVCNNKYTTKAKDGKSGRKTCSNNCLSILASKNSSSNINCGARAGYNKSKRIYHKGILLDSSWELELAEWLDENKISWIRSRKNYFAWIDDLGKTRRYTPDFFLPALNIYLDCKNKYLMKVDATKLLRVRKEHKIKLFTGSVNYIINNVKKINELE